MARVRLVAATGVLVTAVMLTACGAEPPATGGGQAAGSRSVSAPDDAPGAGREDGASVPEKLRFTAKTVDGADFDGASLAGKPAVVWFWASWCPRCQGEAPGVRKAAEETEGAVTFLGVAALSDVPAMRGFVDRYGVGGFTHLADEDAAVWKRFGVVAQPAYAFVGADGTVEVVTNRVSAEDLLDRARKLAG